MRKKQGYPMIPREEPNRARQGQPGLEEASALAFEWHKIYARVNKVDGGKRCTCCRLILNVLVAPVPVPQPVPVPARVPAPNSFRMQLRRCFSSLLYYLLLDVSLADRLPLWKSIWKSKSQLMRHQQIHNESGAGLPPDLQYPASSLAWVGRGEGSGDSS